MNGTFTSSSSHFPTPLGYTLKLRFTVSTEKRSPFSRWIWKQQNNASSRPPLHQFGPDYCAYCIQWYTTTHIFVTLPSEVLTACLALVALKLCLTLVHKALTPYMWSRGLFANAFEHGHLTASAFQLKWLCHCPAAILQHHKTSPNIFITCYMIRTPPTTHYYTFFCKGF